MILLALLLQMSGWDGLRQIPTLTPGATVTVTTAQVCKSGYSTSVRNVPQPEKTKVFAEYHVMPKPGAYEIDHLISLELGGSNEIANLWPQSYVSQPYNAHVKDSLENKLHYMVCHDALTLDKAQQAIRTDWIAACRLYVPGCPKGVQ